MFVNHVRPPRTSENTTSRHPTCVIVESINACACDPFVAGPPCVVGPQLIPTRATAPSPTPLLFVGPCRDGGMDAAADPANQMLRATAAILAFTSRATGGSKGGTRWVRLNSSEKLGETHPYHKMCVYAQFPHRTTASQLPPRTTCLTVATDRGTACTREEDTPPPLPLPLCHRLLSPSFLSRGGPPCPLHPRRSLYAPSSAPNLHRKT